MTAPLTAGLRSIDIRQAAPADYAALNALSNAMRAERLPDDPPRSLEETIQQARNLPPVVDLYYWVIDHPDGTGLVASADTQILRLEQNQHLAQFSIDVLPAFRRRGLATTLLRHVTGAVVAEGRSLMMGGTNDRVPAGEAFMTALGAEKALVGHTNQLVLADLDRQLVHDWIAAAAANIADYDLVFWDGRYPDDAIEPFARLLNVMNTAPRDDLQMDDIEVNTELVRQLEAMTLATGSRRWTLVAHERATGHFAGYTEITWHPLRPQIIHQQGTVVDPNHRNRGLGRWLKAAMLDNVLRELPEARFVRTGNADSNAPMLKINRELGFQPYIAEAQWQIETAQVQAWLAAR